MGGDEGRGEGQPCYDIHGTSEFVSIPQPSFWTAQWVDVQRRRLLAGYAKTCCFRFFPPIAFRGAGLWKIYAAVRCRCRIPTRLKSSRIMCFCFFHGWMLRDGWDEEPRVKFMYLTWTWSLTGIWIHIINLSSFLTYKSGSVLKSWA